MSGEEIFGELYPCFEENEQLRYFAYVNYVLYGFNSIQFIAVNLRLVDLWRCQFELVKWVSSLVVYYCTFRR